MRIILIKRTPKTLIPLKEACVMCNSGLELRWVSNVLIQHIDSMQVRIEENRVRRGTKL